MSSASGREAVVTCMMTPIVTFWHRARVDDALVRRRLNDYAERNPHTKKARDRVERMDDFVLEDLFSISDEDLLKEAMEEGIDLDAVGEAGRASPERSMPMPASIAVVRNAIRCSSTPSLCQMTRFSPCSRSPMRK